MDVRMAPGCSPFWFGAVDADAQQPQVLGGLQHAQAGTAGGGEVDVRPLRGLGARELGAARGVGPGGVGGAGHG